MASKKPAPKRRPSKKRPPQRMGKAAAAAAARASLEPKKGKGKAKPKRTREGAKAVPAAKAPPPATAHPAYANAHAAAEAALSKKAEKVVILDVRGLTSYADFFVVASGSSDRQVSAIADAIEEELKKRGQRPLGVEGYTQGRWVLIDYPDIVCHVFYDEDRAFYDIEGLWADAPRIPVEG